VAAPVQRSARFGKLKRRVLIALGVLFIAVGVTAAVIVHRALRVPLPPPAPELETVTLEPLEPGPPSDELRAAVARGAALRQASAVSLEPPQWLDEPESLLGTEAADHLRELRVALLAPGCLRTPPYGSLGSDPFMLLENAIEALRVRIVALAQVGRAADAKDELLSTLRGLHRLRTECPMLISGTSMLELTVQRVYEAAGYVLTSESLDAADRTEFLEALARVDRERTPWEKAVRVEYGSFMEAWPRLAGEFEGSDALTYLAIRERMYKRLLHLAEQPPDSPLYGRETPEERYAHSFAEHDDTSLSLRVGATVVMAYTTSATEITTTRVRMARSPQCRWALQRAKWTRELQARDPGLVAPEATNPVFGVTVDPDDEASLSCPDERGNAPQRWSSLPSLPPRVP
jgi:hypothetical protein